MKGEPNIELARKRYRSENKVSTVWIAEWTSCRRNELYFVRKHMVSTEKGATRPAYFPIFSISSPIFSQYFRTYKPQYPLTNQPAYAALPSVNARVPKYPTGLPTPIAATPSLFFFLNPNSTCSNRNTNNPANPAVNAFRFPPFISTTAPRNRASGTFSVKLE